MVLRSLTDAEREFRATDRRLGDIDGQILRLRDRINSVSNGRILNPTGKLFPNRDVLLHLGFDDCWQIDPSTMGNYFIGSRQSRCLNYPAHAVAASRGALHYVPGRWPERKAVVVEKATENLITNPIFGHATWDNDWSRVGGSAPTATEEGIHVSHGNSSAKVTFTGGGSLFASDTIASKAILDGVAQTLSAWVKTTATDVRLTILGNNTSGIAYSGYHPGDGQWHRMVITATIDYDQGGATTYIFAGVIGQTNATIAYVDGFQLELYGYATTLAVGNIGDGYSWSGAAHASTSDRVANYIDLRDQVGIVDGRGQFSVRAVFQVPYAAADTWPNATWVMLWETYLNAGNRIRAYFATTGKYFAVLCNGSYIMIAGDVAFQAGDWLDMVWTFDFTSDIYRTYVNGKLYGESTAALTAPTGLTGWAVGASVTPNLHGGFAFSEYTVFSRVLREHEIKELYRFSLPVVDQGGFHNPVMGRDGYYYDIANNWIYFLAPSGLRFITTT